MSTNLDCESFLSEEFKDFNEFLSEKCLIDGVSWNRSPVNLSDISTFKRNPQNLLACQVNDSTQDECEIKSLLCSLYPELSDALSIVGSSDSFTFLKEAKQEPKSFRNLSGKILESQSDTPTQFLARPIARSEDRISLLDEEILKSILYEETMKDESVSLSAPFKQKQGTLDAEPEEEVCPPSSTSQNKTTWSADSSPILRSLLTQSPNEDFNFRVPSIQPIRRKKKRAQLPYFSQFIQSIQPPNKEFNFLIPSIPPIRKKKKTPQLPSFSHFLSPLNPKSSFCEVSTKEELNFPPTYYERGRLNERELIEICQLLPELQSNATQFGGSSLEQSSSRSLVRKVAIEDEFLAWTRELV